MKSPARPPSTDIIQIRRSRIVAIFGLVVCCALAYACLDFKFFNHMHWNKSLDRHSMLVWVILGVALFCIATCLRNAVHPDVVLRATRDGIEIGGAFGNVQTIPWREVVDLKEISIRDSTAAPQARGKSRLAALQIVFSNSIDLGRVGWPLAYPEGNTFVVASTLLRAPLGEALSRLQAMKDSADT